MKGVWNKIHNFLKRTNGMTLVETLVALTVVTAFGTGVASVVVTANASSAKADVISHFDRQNEMAIAEFKTNPDPEYLSAKEPFRNMSYSPASVSFNQHYDKSFQPTSAVDAPYYVSYQYKAKSENIGFTTKGTEVMLEITNQRRLANGTYENLQTSAAQGTGMIHTLSLTNIPVDSVPIPTPDPPSAKTSCRVSFIIEGGTFKDEERDKRTVVVDKGTSLSAILPKADELQAANTGVPTRFAGWKKTGTSQTIPANTGMTVNSDMSVSGVFEGVPCTVAFRIDYYDGCWFNGAGGATTIYHSQQGARVDGDAVIQAFGRKNLKDLFPGGVIFGGWFDALGNELKTGPDGTVLTEGWDGKTVTAKVTIPSVTVKVNITEGEAKGTYSINAAIGGTVKTGDIAAAAGKDYSKIENAGKKILSGWKRVDNGTAFVPGTTVCTSDWNNVIIETVYKSAVQPNADLPLNAEIADANRSYWDITSSTIDFVNTGGKLQLRVKENASKANTAPTFADYMYYDLGNVDALKQKITDPTGDLKLNLNVGYNYYSVKDYLQKWTDKQLYFNGSVNQAMTGKFDNSGPSFNLSPDAVKQLKDILGVTGNVTVNPVFTKHAQPTPGNRAGLWREKVAMLLDLGTVSPKGRVNDEKYKLMLRYSNPRVDADGTVVYQIGLIGQNGDNILDPSKKMDITGFYHEGTVTHPQASTSGTCNIPLGSVGSGETWSDVRAIDNLSLLIKNVNSTGPGFRLLLETKEPYNPADVQWEDSGWRGWGGAYKKHVFDDVEMTDDSVVQVKHLTVYVQSGDISGRPVPFDNHKPVNLLGLYGKDFRGYTFHGGFVMQDSEFDGDGATGHGWTTNDDAEVTNHGEWQDYSPITNNHVDPNYSIGPAPIPLPGSMFKIK